MKFTRSTFYRLLAAAALTASGAAMAAGNHAGGHGHGDGEETAIGKPGVAAKAAQRMQTIYPKLNVVGVMHGYQSRAHSVRTIKNSGARFVLCGMGAPNQEAMLMALKQAGFSGSAFSCGGFLDQVVEKKEYYPRWVDRLEVRCLYRLAREPRRLCRRYLYEYQAFVRQFLQTMLTRPPRSARTDESP